MNSGQRLIKQFGLEYMKNAKMIQWITSPVRTLMIVYDSFRPTTPITHNFLRQFPFPVFVADNVDLKKEPMLPPVDLKDFRGQLAGRIVVVVDLAGRWADERRYTKVFEGFVGWMSKTQLTEARTESGFTIQDFLTNGTSDRNRFFLNQRKSEGNSGAKLTSLSFNKRKHTLRLQYKVTPTFDSTVGVTTNTWNAGSKGDYTDPLYAKTARSYKVVVLFDNVEEHVGTLPEFLALSEVDQVEFIVALVNDCPVRVHSNDKSFYFQGVWENGDELGYAVHPFPGVRGEGEWSMRHVGEDPGIYTTKHIVEVFETVRLDVAEIVKRINSKYR